MLEGEVLCEKLGAETWVHAFSVTDLPLAPAERFAALFRDQDIGMVEKIAMDLADIAYGDNALEVGQDVSCKLSFIMSLLVSIIGRMPILVVTYVFGLNVKFK